MGPYHIDNFVIYEINIIEFGDLTAYFWSPLQRLTAYFSSPLRRLTAYFSSLLRRLTACFSAPLTLIISYKLADLHVMRAKNKIFTFSIMFRKGIYFIYQKFYQCDRVPLSIFDSSPKLFFPGSLHSRKVQWNF